MPDHIDDLLSTIRAITLQLDSLSPDDHGRSDLVAERDALRAEARALAGASRHPQSVEAEIAMLEKRRSEIDNMFIGKGHSEKHLTKGFSDPGAYSAVINRKLADDHANEIEEITSRLEELRSIGSPGEEA